MNGDIDREIAEKVMGWRLDEKNFWMDGKNKWTFRMKYPPHKAYQYCRNKYWQPSENIAQAFEVVEKMLSMNWEFVIVWLNERGKWRAAFGESQGNDKTPAMAICLAALEAVK